MKLKMAKNRRSVIAKLGIGCGVCLLLGFGILLHAQEKTKAAFIGTKPEKDSAKMQEMNKMKKQAEAQRKRARQRQGSGSVDFGENAAFYKVIIDNNLFRPLNWEPLQSESAYMLLGTAIVTDGSEATAYIQERESGQFHAVTLGDPIGTVTVEEIAPKRVTLITEQGDTLTLDFAGFRFLNPRRSRSPSIQRDDRPPQRANRTEKRTVTKDKSRKTSAPEMKPQYGHEGPIEYLRQQAEEIRSERRRMQERLRYLQQR